MGTKLMGRRHAGMTGCNTVVHGTPVQDCPQKLKKCKAAMRSMRLLSKKGEKKKKKKSRCENLIPQKLTRASKND